MSVLGPALLGSVVHAQPLGPPVGRDVPYDVLDYDFRVDVRDSSAMRVVADVRVAFAPCELATCSLPAVVLDLVGRRAGGTGMAVDSVWAAPAVSPTAWRAVRWRHAADRVAVALPEPERRAGGLDHASAAVWIVRLAYRGRAADGLIRSSDAQGRTWYFGDNWPQRARHYLAVHDHPADKATVTWRVTAPEALRVVANGRFTGRTCQSGACETAYRSDIPISTKVMVFGAAPFAVERAGEAAGVPVESWVFEGERAAGFREYAAAVPIVAYFDSLLAPFPYEKLANVQSRTRFGGMENAGAIFYHAGSARGDGSQEGLLAHEIAHQWFGNWATEADWPHLWLSEGFATYLAHVWTQRRQGDAAFAAGLARDRETVRRFVAATPVPVVDTVRTDPLDMLDANVYPRGAWVLHLLRREAGEDAFWDALRGYLLRHGGRTATTDDLQAAFEAETGRSFEAFFEQWTRRTDLPTLLGSWRYDAARREVVVSLRQTQPRANYSFPLDVQVGDRLVTVAFDEVREELRVPASQRPASVRLDPHVRLLFAGPDVLDEAQ